MIIPELGTLSLVVGGAAAVPYVSRRLRFPAAVLEILYGVVLFRLLVHERPEWFGLLKELGFIYLMFLAGMELDLRSLFRSPRLAWYTLLPALSLGLTPLLFLALGLPPYLGLAAAVLSAGIAVPLLKESELIRTPLGRDILGTALVGEVLSIVVLTAVDTYQAHGFSGQAALVLAKLAALLALAAVALKAIYLVSWWHPEHVDRLMQSRDPAEEGVRGVILMAFAGALAAQAAGVEPILGSFMGGLVTSSVFRNKGRFEDKVNAVGFGFFTPFFFIGVGADLDLSVAASARGLGLTGLITLAAFAGKVVALPLSRAMGLRVRECLALTLLLAAPMSMMVAAGALGERMGLLSREEGAALVLASLLASVLFPLLFRPLVQRRAPLAG